MEHERLRNYQSDYLRRARKNNFIDKIKAFSLPFIVLTFLLLIILNSFKKNKIITATKPLISNSPDEILEELSGRNYPTLQNIEEGRFVEYVNKNKVVYTVDPKLQKKIYSIFKNYKVPYGSFIAIDPSTGKILAYVAYTNGDYDISDFNQKAVYPMASLFKIITAAGVIEEGLLARTSVFGYEGNPYKLSRRKIVNNPKRDRNLSTLEDALGKSNNVVFGKVGANILGKKNLNKYAERFFFNRKIEFDFPLEISRAMIPSDPYRLAKVSAGFNGVKTSPLHTALIAATIAEGGNMPRPFIVDKIIDPNGEVIFQAKPTYLNRVISERTAKEVRKMMLRTVKIGTSASVFRKYSSKMVKSVKIGGKTGTLTGNNPKGLYDWFVGFAPENGPRIALSALVINNHKWRIKGSYVAQAAFKSFFKY